MSRRITPILAAIVTSMLIGGLAWAAGADPDAAAPTSTSLADPVTGTFVFEAGAAGAVTVSSDGSTLWIDGVDASAGWTSLVEIATGREVEVTFRASDDRIDFKAELEDGNIRVRVRVRSTGEETTTIVSDQAGSAPDATIGTTPVDDSAPTTLPDEDDGTSTTLPNDDDSTSTTLPNDDDSTSTTLPNDDEAAAAAGTYTYAVGDAGSVTVTVSGHVLILDSVSTGSGWHAIVEKAEPDRVRVEFDNGDHDSEIDIRLEHGGLSVDIDN